ncbi:MAG: response regulator [Desulfobulbaceae bacterium]|nr:response regulator [Desulfobulbaceae bacterium]
MGGKSYRVLIVDDSKSVLSVLSEAFKESPFQVITTDSPLRAYEIIEKEPVDIVISDIEMPDMNGLDLLKKIKAHNGMIKVIIITGYITVNNTLNAFRYGAEDLFFKPVNPEMIVSAAAVAAERLERVRSLLTQAAMHKGKK